MGVKETFGKGKKVVEEKLLPYASNWWFPWLVGVMSGMNIFILFLSGPLSVLFLAGALARPQMRFVAAFANAFGCTLGICVLVYIGLNSEFFPSFEGEEWNNTRKIVEDYMFAGVILISSLPILLHPMIFFALPLMDPMALILSVFVGRMLKYSIMAQVAYTGKTALKKTADKTD